MIDFHLLWSPVYLIAQQSYNLEPIKIYKKRKRIFLCVIKNIYTGYIMYNERAKLL